MKQYVIVGGSSGIGLSIANSLSAAGNKVRVLSRSSNDVWDENIEYRQVDVLNEMPENDLEELNGLVYCPGSINLRPFQSLSENDYLNDFQINVIGAVKTIKTFLKALKKTEGSSIILFSTVAVAQGMPFHASVASSKGAVEGLTRSLAAELAPKVRVNCIAPSITDTPLAAKLLSNDEKKEKSGERHPLKRVGRPEDVASVASFLLSEQASWISGQVLGVDGGMSALRPL
ncbi:SDR family oxidoreductase [Fulvivirga sp. M361]|uniref:SDR family NAD(P)-dependent oxidoreductase n=1 Tax=Fulvivirga sp. M361 TaxID=2594266 RepID=UPI00117B795B|nr:SDR family oxidoreductase [Fulvivirga sp. M361]